MGQHRMCSKCKQEPVKIRSSGIAAWYCLDCLTQNKKEYRKSHADQIRESKRKYWAANSVRLRLQQKAYNEAHPEVRQAKWARRKALKRGASVNDLSAAQWRMIQADQEGRCFYCEDEAILTQDHMTPLSRGGSHTFSNVVGACLPCNLRKGTKTAGEFVGSNSA